MKPGGVGRGFKRIKPFNINIDLTKSSLRDTELLLKNFHADNSSKERQQIEKMLETFSEEEKKHLWDIYFKKLGKQATGP